ncbi:MAG TPA: CRISPR-associated protein Csx19 [Ktedonobacteraceae bacterium]|nr:CRISPR-associated protein Csx19 [Ktedonobacteraceae bacterium]
MRKKIDMTVTCKRIPVNGFADDPVKWLVEQMRAHDLKLTYLLAHASDGVIWGRFDDEELITSHDVAPRHSPPLRVETLLTARVFAPVGELLVWRDEDGEWATRLIAEKQLADATTGWNSGFEEQQVLLGTRTDPLKRGFTLMSEGAQGLFHAVPLELSLSGGGDERWHPLRLVVHHYWQEDEHGFTRVHTSRLVDLALKEGNA